MGTHTVAWKYADGSGGRCDFGEYESAFAYMLIMAGQSPQARVWFDDDVVQRGDVGDDERGQS